MYAGSRNPVNPRHFRLLLIDVPQPRILPHEGTLQTSGIAGFNVIIVENTVSCMVYNYIAIHAHATLYIYMQLQNEEDVLSDIRQHQLEPRREIVIQETDLYSIPLPVDTPTFSVNVTQPEVHHQPSQVNEHLELQQLTEQQEQEHADESAPAENG